MFTIHNLHLLATHIYLIDFSKVLQGVLNLEGDNADAKITGYTVATFKNMSIYIAGVYDL